MADLLRYVNTDLNLSIGRSTISRILQYYNIVSYIVPRKPRITPTQRQNHLTWCYDHLNWSINDWSNVIFSDESNFEVLNRKNRISICRFRNDRTRFERSQNRVHKGGGVGVWSYVTCHNLEPLVIFDGHLNSIEYINILETYLPTAFQKYPPAQLPKIFYQHDSARPHASTRTKNCLKRKRIKQIIWSTNSPDIDIIGNIWSIIDNKLLKFTINDVDELIN